LAESAEFNQACVRSGLARRGPGCLGRRRQGTTRVPVLGRLQAERFEKLALFRAVGTLEGVGRHAFESITPHHPLPANVFARIHHPFIDDVLAVPPARRAPNRTARFPLLNAPRAG
jgi:hypothetical protein